MLNLEEDKATLYSVNAVNFRQNSNPVITGPSLIVIGYIPHFISAFKDSVYSQFSWWKNLGFWLLCKSGNTEPPEALCTKSFELKHCGCEQKTIMEFFQENPPERPEFRTVCWLRDVNLQPQSNGKACLSFVKGHRVGKTPMPISPESPFRQRIGYFDGRGEDIFRDVVWGEDNVTFTYKHTFKLGWKANLGSAIFSGCFAPSALIEIKYTLNTDGSYKIYFGGSTIPTQNLYVECIRQSYWDMVQTNNKKGVESFIYAGDCNTAPNRREEFCYFK